MAKKKTKKKTAKTRGNHKLTADNIAKLIKTVTRSPHLNTADRASMLKALKQLKD